MIVVFCNDDKFMYNDDKFCGESCTFDIYPFTRLSCCMQIFNGFDWHLAAECHRICTLDPRHIDITPRTESKTELNTGIAKRDSTGVSDTFVRRETNDLIEKRNAMEQVFRTRISVDACINHFHDKKSIRQFKAAIMQRIPGINQVLVCATMKAHGKRVISMVMDWDHVGILSNMWFIMLLSETETLMIRINNTPIHGRDERFTMKSVWFMEKVLQRLTLPAKHKITQKTPLPMRSVTTPPFFLQKEYRAMVGHGGPPTEACLRRVMRSKRTTPTMQSHSTRKQMSDSTESDSTKKQMSDSTKSESTIPHKAIKCLSVVRSKTASVILPQQHLRSKMARTRDTSVESVSKKKPNRDGHGLQFYATYAQTPKAVTHHRLLSNSPQPPRVTALGDLVSIMPIGIDVSLTDILRYPTDNKTKNSFRNIYQKSHSFTDLNKKSSSFKDLYDQNQ